MEFLSRNASQWSKALVMAMDEEGYAMLEPADVVDRETLGKKLGTAI